MEARLAARVCLACVLGTCTLAAGIDCSLLSSYSDRPFWPLHAFPRPFSLARLSTLFRVASLTALLTFSFRKFLPYAFTSDEEVAASVSRILRILAIFILVDHIQVRE
jgi:hypothetical protein